MALYEILHFNRIISHSYCFQIQLKQSDLYIMIQSLGSKANISPSIQSITQKDVKNVPFPS